MMSVLLTVQFFVTVVNSYHISVTVVRSLLEHNDPMNIESVVLVLSKLISNDVAVGKCFSLLHYIAKTMQFEKTKLKLEW